MTTRDYVLYALNELNMSKAALAREANVTYDVVNKLHRRETADTSAENGYKIRQYVSGRMSSDDVTTIIQGRANIADKLHQLEPEQYQAVLTLVDTFLAQAPAEDQ